MTGLDPRMVARALGGVVSGRNVRAPGPGHSRMDDSLAVHLDDNAPEGFVVFSHAGDDPLLCRDFVKERLGLPNGKRYTNRVPVRSHPARKDVKDETARTDLAISIWAEAVSPVGSPVEVYLRKRGLDLPKDAGESFRFHSRCPFNKGKTTPALVCLARNVITDKPQAIHRTALTLAGRKVEIEGNDRLSLGPMRGAAIMITPSENVTTCLGVAEGIENALSLHQLPEYRGSPIWSLVSAGGVTNFPVLSGIECLWIAVDHDPVGLKSSQACMERWLHAGREVFDVTPILEHSDLNDTMKGRGNA